MYGASKAALESVTMSLAKELGVPFPPEQVVYLHSKLNAIQATNMKLRSTPSILAQLGRKCE